MRFRDRRDAGRRLGAALKKRGFSGSLVLGIPRGGVPVAAEVAAAIGGELGVVVARKLRAPGQPELAIGAVAADGTSWTNDGAVAMTGADEAFIRREIAHQAAEARRREDLFDGRRTPLKGRDVIVVDDGLATGATAIVACRRARREGARRVVLAVPVAPPASVLALRHEADEVLCLFPDDAFESVGQSYDDFEQVEDGEVATLLEAWRRSARKAVP